MKKIIVGIIITVLVAISIGLIAGFSFRASLGPPLEHYPERAIYAPNGTVATSQPLASQAGLAVLQNGGNAIDAAVTAAAVLSVVEPYMSGIGGDMFALLWSEKEKRLIGINASGRSGSLMTREALSDVMRIPGDGPKTITIPGTLSGWTTLLEKYGSISLKEALKPAIKLAKDGFPISELSAAEWKIFEAFLEKDSSAAATFLIDSRRSPKTGEWYSNPSYAKTLEDIGELGPEYLYGGELGNKIAQHVQSLGGFLTAEDFAKHEPSWVEPISVSFKGYNIWQLPPNGQGLAVLEMMRILESFDLERMEYNSAEYLHHLIEAKKLAYADLEEIVGDPNQMVIKPQDVLTDAYIENRRALIKPQKALTHIDPDPSLTHSETTYLTVADQGGNMVSFISSLAGSFGSGIVVPETGFTLQNRGVGFTYDENRVNTVAPNTLPFHTIIPGFVSKRKKDGQEEPWLAFGLVGGPQQPQAKVQLLLNMILFDMDVQEALNAPRFRHWEANRVSFESQIPESTVKILREMGHRPQAPLMETAQTIFLEPNGGLIYGCGQAIMKNKRGYVAGSDIRRDGAAVGY